MTLGTNVVKVEFPMVIYEQASPNLPHYEVILAMDFLAKFGVQVDYGGLRRQKWTRCKGRGQLAGQVKDLMTIISKKYKIFFYSRDSVCKLRSQGTWHQSIRDTLRWKRSTKISSSSGPPPTMSGQWSSRFATTTARNGKNKGIHLQSHSSFPRWIHHLRVFVQRRVLHRRHECRRWKRTRHSESTPWSHQFMVSNVPLLSPMSRTCRQYSIAPAYGRIRREK